MSTCEQKFCKRVFVPKAITQLRKIEKVMKKRTQINDKTKKILYDTCVNAYCNPSCKDTHMTEEKVTPVMKQLIENFINVQPFMSKNKKTIKRMMNIIHKHYRQTIKKYKQPLKEGFYRGLSDADVKFLRSKGAVSGCSIDLPRHLRS